MDIATEAIADSLLSAEKLGAEQLKTFVRERLFVSSEGQLKKKFRDPLSKVCVSPFSSLFKVKKAARGKEVTIKADRNLMHRLILAHEADREDDLSRVLQHELMAVLIALA